MIRTIVSIWPLQLAEFRRFIPMYQNSIHPASNFVMEPAPPGGFTTMQVVDVNEPVYIGSGRNFLRTESADVLAADLVQSYQKITRGESGSVGVWVAEQEQPTKEEILSSPQYQRAVEEQNKLMHNIVKEARIHYDKKNQDAISRLHHVAAAWLKIEGEEWQGGNSARESRKECPFCYSYIAAKAVICPICTREIDPEGIAAISASIKKQVDDISGSALRPARTAVKA